MSTIPLDVNTLIINGVEVRVKPVSLDVGKSKASKNKVDLPCGPVVIHWPGLSGTMTIQANYQNLDEEDAEAILILCTMNGGGDSKTMPSNIVQFARNGPTYTTKTLRCELTESEGQNGWNATLTAIMNWVPL